MNNMTRWIGATLLGAGVLVFTHHEIIAIPAELRDAVADEIPVKDKVIGGSAYPVPEPGPPGKRAATGAVKNNREERNDPADIFAKEHACSAIRGMRLPKQVLSVLKVNGVPASEIRLWIAQTRREEEYGLMCQVLEADEGMVFADNANPSTGVWMYQTYIPLSVLFTDKDSRIVDIAQMKPCPRAPGASNTEWYNTCISRAYTAAPGSRYMLEITPEFFRKLRLKPGDVLSFDPVGRLIQR